MFIRNCITYTQDLVTLKSNDTIENTIEILQKNNLKSIPVVEKNNKYLGILSKEILFEQLEQNLSKSIEEFKKDTIENAVLYIEPLKLDSFFEETLSIIVRYPFVPIIDDTGILIGIVKRKNITNSLEISFGKGIPGIRLLIGTPELEGRLEKVLKIAHSYHINIITALVFDAGEKFNRRILLKIAFTNQKDNFLETIKENGFKLLNIYEDNK